MRGLHFPLRGTVGMAKTRSGVVQVQSRNFFFDFDDGIKFFSHAFLLIVSQPAKRRGGLSNANIGQASTAWLTLVY